MNELLRYTDADGDTLTVAWWPVDDTGEDLWVCISPATNSEERPVAVRVPLGALRGALQEAGE